MSHDRSALRDAVSSAAYQVAVSAMEYDDQNYPDVFARYVAEFRIAREAWLTDLGVLTP